MQVVEELQQQCTPTHMLLNWRGTPTRIASYLVGLPVGCVPLRVATIHQLTTTTWATLCHARMRTHSRVLAQMEHLPSPVATPTMYGPVGVSLTFAGYHRLSANIDGIFELLTDSDDDEGDYMCRVWAWTPLPEGVRDELAQQ